MAQIKPAKLPEWATDVGADIVEPSQAQKEDGWDVSDRPPAGWLNWKANNIFQWLNFMRHITIENRETIELDPAAAYTNAIGIVFPVLGSASSFEMFWILAGNEGIQKSITGRSKSWDEKYVGGTWYGGCETKHGTNSNAIVVGITGTIRTSIDGVTWTARTAAGGYTGTFRAVDRHWTGSLWRLIAVGSGGEIQTSDDGGVTWTQRTAAGSYTGQFNGITASGSNRIVIVGTGGEIQYSDDSGVTWNQATAAGSYTDEFEGVTVGPNGYVAVGNLSEVQYSSDGINWFQATLPSSFPGDRLTAVAWGFAGYVAVGNLGAIISSIDAINWEKHTQDRNHGTDEYYLTIGTDWTTYMIGGEDLTGGYSNSVLQRTMAAGGWQT